MGLKESVEPVDFALVRLLGDLGKVVAVLLLIVQVSAAGALLPIQLNDEAFQAMQPYLPLIWVVSAFRASMFGAYDGMFWPQLGVVGAIAAAALVVGTVAGRWRVMPLAEWRPPLDIKPCGVPSRPPGLRLAWTPR